MWMLDDFTEENGATRIVPGSHMSGWRLDPEKDKDVPTIATVAPAGGAMVFEGRLWHGTGANGSHASRAGLQWSEISAPGKLHGGNTAGSP